MLQLQKLMRDQSMFEGTPFEKEIDEKLKKDSASV